MAANGQPWMMFCSILRRNFDKGGAGVGSKFLREHIGRNLCAAWCPTVRPGKELGMAAL